MIHEADRPERPPSDRSSPDLENIVRSLFTLAGVAPPDDEIASFAASYAHMRSVMKQLYAVGDPQVADGILVFRPADH